ncbi:hypothetical protein NP233_g3635 [Leucocoprinus birnbaumii]|uniref:Transmembrane protein n=1 Tax=Leucocoprinus birnbaumii TaxID=56174 RepID=A0AAD5VXK9_9AGAR|nr:hypothetical protein NP233_g3635 [Leucocoprinus birnbaumii]
MPVPEPMRDIQPLETQAVTTAPALSIMSLADVNPTSTNARPVWASASTMTEADVSAGRLQSTIVGVEMTYTTSGMYTTDITTTLANGQIATRLLTTSGTRTITAVTEVPTQIGIVSSHEGPPKALIGGVIAVLSVVILALVTFCVLWRRRKRFQRKAGRAAISEAFASVGWKTNPRSSPQHRAQLRSRPFLDSEAAQINVSPEKAKEKALPSLTPEQEQDPFRDPEVIEIVVVAPVEEQDDVRRAQIALDRLQQLTSQLEAELEQLNDLALRGQLSGENRVRLEEIKRTIGQTVPLNARMTPLAGSNLRATPCLALSAYPSETWLTYVKPQTRYQERAVSSTSSNLRSTLSAQTRTHSAPKTNFIFPGIKGPTLFIFPTSLDNASSGPTETVTLGTTASDPTTRAPSIPSPSTDPEVNSVSPSSKANLTKPLIASLVSVAVALLIGLGICLWFKRRRRNMRRVVSMIPDHGDILSESSEDRTIEIRPSAPSHSPARPFTEVQRNPRAVSTKRIVEKRTRTPLISEPAGTYRRADIEEIGQPPNPFETPGEALDRLRHLTTQLETEINGFNEPERVGRLTNDDRARLDEIAQATASVAARFGTMNGHISTSSSGSSTNPPSYHSNDVDQRTA